MNKEAYRTIGLVVGTGLALYELSKYALTYKQRSWVRDVRDEGQCQFPYDHPCVDDKQVHHIIPQRLGGEDVPENLISLCENIHPGCRQTVEEGKAIHPDIVEAKRQYSINRDAFAQTFAQRNEKIGKGELYHNTSFDEEFTEIAKQNTERAKAKGEVFPPRNGTANQTTKTTTEQSPSHRGHGNNGHSKADLPKQGIIYSAK